MARTSPDTQESSGPEAGDNRPPVLSVSELSGAVKRAVEDNFGYVRVRGEVSGLHRAGSGHLYMSLKDAGAVIDAVCWRNVAMRLDIQPEDGIEVVITGRVSTYAPRSKYQLVVERIEVAGEGALLKMIEDRRKRLAEEGLFDADRKAELPFLPEVIGVVTSPGGAVIRDILHRLSDRFPRHVLLWPTPVQGEGAAERIAGGIEGFNAIGSGAAVPRPDLLIVARGGGSLEDLMAFNEEVVVRAAAASAIPLISAVGHETDTTLIDFASDLRAPTPTAAAEMAVPVRADLIAQISGEGARLTRAMPRLLDRRAQEVAALGRGLLTPRRILEGAMQRVDDWAERLHPALGRMMRAKAEEVANRSGRLIRPDRYMDAKYSDLWVVAGRLRRGWSKVRSAAGHRLAVADGLLESYSYKGVLERGFVLVRDAAGRPVPAADALSPGDSISLSFRNDGEVGARVESVGTGGAADGTPEARKPAAANGKPAGSSGAPETSGSSGAPGDSQGSLL